MTKELPNKIDRAAVVAACNALGLDAQACAELRMEPFRPTVVERGAVPPKDALDIQQPGIGLFEWTRTFEVVEND